MTQDELRRRCSGVIHVRIFPSLSLECSFQAMTVFNLHSLHLSHDPDNCPECDINKKHYDRWEAALAEGPISRAKQNELSEQHRQDWLAWDHNVVIPEPIRRDKARRIAQFIVDHHEETVTLQQVIEEIECVPATAYQHVRNDPLSFRRIGTAMYYVTDRARVRAETLAREPARIAQDAPAGPLLPIATGPIARAPSKP